MENFWARQSHDAMGAEHGSAMNRFGEPNDLPCADDPLGDEAAFPSTWQHLSAGDSLID